MSGPDAPSPWALSAVSDRGETHLGAPFRVVVELRHDAAQRYALAGTQAPGPFAILSGGCRTRVAGIEGETRCEVELALLDLGTHAPVLRLDATGSVGTRVVEVRATPVAALPVTDPAIPAAEIPLRGMPEPVPLFVPTWEPVAWIALGVALVVSIAVAVVRRLMARLRAAEQRRRSEPPVLSPSEALEARIGALEALGPAGTDPWFELSRAVRVYVSALSPPATLDRTTPEVLAALRAAPVGGLDLVRFAAFAARLDRAKYAGAALDATAWQAALAEARGILEATRPPRWDPGEEARRA